MQPCRLNRALRNLTFNGLRGLRRRSPMLAKKKPPENRNRRVTRVEPPVLEEAVVAAQGRTDDTKSQVEIAAQLMALREDGVRPLVLKWVPQPRRSERLPE